MLWFALKKCNDKGFSGFTCMILNMFLMVKLKLKLLYETKMGPHNNQKIQKNNVVTLTINKRGNPILLMLIV